jgi:hypothetical protein
MGSFNFKEAPFYREKTPLFIGEVSRTILPLREIQGEERLDIKQVQLDRKLTKI